MNLYIPQRAVEAVGVRPPYGTKLNPHIIRSPELFENWLQTARPGKWGIYWIGILMEDRESKYPQLKGLATSMARIADKAQSSGRIILCQSRATQSLFNYYAIRR